MTERNAPCPCGSGKKYKKCCAKKETISQEQLVEEELIRVYSGYSEKLFQQRPGHFNYIGGFQREWQNKLGKSLPAEDIEMLLADYYMYVVQKEQWTRYILKTMNGPIRSKTREVLADWQQPVVLIGKVIGEDEGYYEVEEVLGHDRYRLAKEEFDDVKENALLVGIILKDTRDVENGVFLVSEMLGVQDLNGTIAKKIQELAEASGETNRMAFFEAYMLEVYQILLIPDEKMLQELVDSQLTVKQQLVLEALAFELEFVGESEERIETAKMLAMGYLVEGNPSFRKPATIAAAVFKAMDNFGLLEMHDDFSQKEVAELFEVSVSSMVKHIEPIEDQIEAIMADMLSQTDLPDGPVITYNIGTDPRVTERANWEMFCRMEESDTDSFDDLEMQLTEMMNTVFIPKGKAQKAQDYAYEAYAQEEHEERIRLAALAYKTDANNVDAVLLKAEETHTAKKAEVYYKRAILLGRQTFDDEDIDLPWKLVTNRPYMRALFTYGVFLYEFERYTEALDYFEQLLDMNPNDEQCARHFAIASAIYSGKYDLARELMVEYGPTPYDENIYLLLDWMLEDEETGDSNRLGLVLDENAYLQEIIQAEIAVPFPNGVGVSAGSVEEALYMACLL